MDNQKRREALLIRVPKGDSWSSYYVLTWPDDMSVHSRHSGVEGAVAWIGESLWPSEEVMLYPIYGDTVSGIYHLTVDGAGNCESRRPR